MRLHETVLTPWSCPRCPGQCGALCVTSRGACARVSECHGSGVAREARPSLAGCWASPQSAGRGQARQALAPPLAPRCSELIGQNRPC